MKAAGEERYQGDWSFWARWNSMFRLSIWFLRGFWYRLFFKSSSGIVLVGPSARILFSNRLSAGRNLVIEKGVELNCLSTRGIHLGDKVSIGAYAIIRPSNLYGGAVGEGLKMGNRSNIGPYSYVGCSGFIEIGNDVMISPRVNLFAENHKFDDAKIPMKDQGVAVGKIVIEDDCWIASNSTILANVTIGRGSVVGAGSVVTKDVPPFSVVAGNPARIIKTRKA